MEIRVVLSGFGAKIPKVPLGVNLATGAYISLRSTPNESKARVYGVTASPSVGGPNGTLIFSVVNTEFRRINTTKHEWICNLPSFTGNTVEVEAKGMVIGSGAVDISITVYDSYGEAVHSITIANVKARGGQLAETKVRGTLHDMAGHAAVCERICSL